MAPRRSHYRSDIVDGQGKLTREWHALFERYLDRF